MLKKIGFFHFGSEDRKRPLESLTASMKEAGGKPHLRESLIVLPEAFNIGVKYEPNSGPCDFDPNIKCCLQGLAADFEVAFVAGLIIKRPWCLGRPYNSAYFISAARSRLLSRKTRDDKTGIYRPSTVVRDLPVMVGEAAIAALVCMDAAECEKRPAVSRERHAALCEKVSELDKACQILCVPANIRYLSTELIAGKWSAFQFVLANGCCLSGAPPSVIGIKGKVPMSFQEQTNKVVVCPLEA